MLVDRLDEHRHCRPLRGHVPRPLRRARPLRPARERDAIGRLPVGADRRGMAAAARRRARGLGRAKLPRVARPRVGPRGRRRPRVPRLVRLAHAPQPQPGGRARVVPGRDGGRRARGARRRTRADARPAPTPRLPVPVTTRPSASAARKSPSCPSSTAFYTWARRRRTPRDDGGDAAVRRGAVGRTPGPSASWRRSSSPTSSARRELAARLGDGAWQTCSARHHAVVPHGARAASTGASSTPPATGSSPSFDGPARAVTAAAAIRDALRPLELEIRAGLHTGECSVSDGKLAGLAVSVGARITQLAAPGEVLVSSTVKDLVAGSGMPVRRPRHARPQGRPGRVAGVRARRVGVTHRSFVVRTVPGCPRRSTRRRRAYDRLVGRYSTPLAAELIAFAARRARHAACSTSAAGRAG